MVRGFSKKILNMQTKYLSLIRIRWGSMVHALWGAWWSGEGERERERYYEAYISYGEKVLLSYAFSHSSS